MFKYAHLNLFCKIKILIIFSEVDVWALKRFKCDLLNKFFKARNNIPFSSDHLILKMLYLIINEVNWQQRGFKLHKEQCDQVMQ